MKKTMTSATMTPIAMPSVALDRLGGRCEDSEDVKKLLQAHR
jgi:hypothetical protein